MRLPSLRDRRGLLFDVQLAVSELVSTGIKTVPEGDTVRLAVHADDRRLRLEVRGHRAAVRPSAVHDGPGPHSLRGLQLVAAVADRWGVEWQDGSMIWAEFDLPAD